MREIAAEALETAPYTGIPEFSPQVMRAMAEVPRHEFVPEEERVSAYLDLPLPIGYGQTISQPYIVALMTDLLEIKPGDKVLEVGAGSGYQAAVLSRLAQTVHTVEIVPALARACRERLSRLGFANVVVHEGDGAQGLENESPFDAIIVTAAARRVPPALVGQLKRGGRMAIPLGEAGGAQELVLIGKDACGEVSTRPVLPVRFVPLTGRG
ncbi:MAG TPA: protein-L-isoaspartate O-methyltransferase [Verrucomicrobia bacterium]|nr:protein-L-isoaspartate O-methyltransferase [Verrucomicrobiota bacterium]